MICDERANQCRCVREKGHDGDHVCDPTRCTGSWSGSWNDDSFKVTSLPFPVDTPRPWDTP